MRFSELTDQQSAALMEEFVQLRLETVPELSRTRQYIAACFMGAGFCIFGCLNALTLAPALSAAATMFVFGVGTAYFFGTAWRKFTAYMTLMRAGERAYLMMVFEKFAERGIEFSTQEVVDFFLLAPDRPPTAVPRDRAPKDA